MTQWSQRVRLRNYFTAGDRLSLGRRRQRGGWLDAVRGQTVTLHRVSGGTQRSLAAFVQDVFTPTDEADAHAQRAGGQLAQLRRAQSRERTCRPAQPTPGNRPTIPDTDDTVGSPRFAALYHVTDRVTAWGDISWGFRAPTLNELYRQFRVGALLTLANDQPRARAAEGRREAASAPAADRQSDDSHDVVRQPRQESGVERDDHADRRTSSSARISAARGFGACRPTSNTAWPLLARGGGVSVQPGEGRGVCGKPGPRRQVPAAGARASRFDAGGVHESAVR